AALTPSVLPPAAGPCPLSLHVALPISGAARAKRGKARRDAEAAHLRRRAHHGRARRHAAARLPRQARARAGSARRAVRAGGMERDRKSTRLNSSHVSISYAVFCLNEKN